MTRNLGISSTSVPALTGSEILELVRAEDLSVYDLSADRGQAWELDESWFSAVRGTASDPIFVGPRLTLGESSAGPMDVVRSCSRFAGTRLRLFAAPGMHQAEKMALIQKQVEALKDAGFTEPDVLLDTHQGKATLADIRLLLTHFDFGIVLDNEGLSFLEDNPISFVSEVKTRVVAVHVKGFDHIPGSLHTHNRELRDTDLAEFENILKPLPEEVPIVLQSTAGHAAEDLELLRRFAG